MVSDLNRSTPSPLVVDQTTITSTPTARAKIATITQPVVFKRGVTLTGLKGQPIELNQNCLWALNWPRVVYVMAFIVPSVI